jgi:hypothetical protein
MTKTYDTDPAPSLSTPDFSIRAAIHELPYTQTAASLSRLAAAQSALSPDAADGGRAHPAADLKAMNDALLTLLHEEGDQSRLLTRQVQVMDSLFHLLLQNAVHFEDMPQADIASPAPGHSINFSTLVLALKTQAQCAHTVRHVSAMDYMSRIAAQMDSGGSSGAPKYPQVPRPLPPSYSDEQTEEDEEW